MDNKIEMNFGDDSTYYVLTYEQLEAYFDEHRGDMLRPEWAVVGFYRPGKVQIVSPRPIPALKKYLLVGPG